MEQGPPTAQNHDVHDAMTERSSPGRPPVRLWVVAAATAALLHVGFVAFAFAPVHTDDEPELGATAIEIGMDLLAPRSEPTNLPPGPEAEASTASPAIVEQRQVIREAALPVEVPTETENPDRVVAPHETKRPKEDDPEVLPAEAAPSTESAASEATAIPSSEAMEEAPRSVAPAMGTGDDAQRVRATWQKELAAHLDRYRRYPSDRSHQAAEVLVGFKLDRLGHVLSAAIVRSSGDASFDAAALDMMHRASPVPQPPPAVADNGLEFALPVVFRA
jgi:TonB family protein